MACNRVEVTQKKLTPYFEIENEVFNEEERN
jgi:hypothetical protein